MCRLLGIAANEATEFRIVLREAPRSLAALSSEHPDGWGIAIFDAHSKTWQIDKGLRCARDDERFHSLAVGSRGEILISHIRQKTVGETKLVNTHPFERGRWVFAHNGTIKKLEWLRSQTSPERLAEVVGDTDSELLFAWLLSCLDESGVSNEAASQRTDRAIAAAARRAREEPDFGAFNFLLSDGATTYAHRFGRAMYILERQPEDTVRSRRTSRDGTVYKTPWSQRRTAIFIASEHITHEPWAQINEGMLLRIERSPSPHWRLVAA
jgi:glutamine amidotransferase